MRWLGATLGAVCAGLTWAPWWGVSINVDAAQTGIGQGISITSQGYSMWETSHHFRYVWLAGALILIVSSFVSEYGGVVAAAGLMAAILVLYFFFPPDVISRIRSFDAAQLSASYKWGWWVAGGSILATISFLLYAGRSVEQTRPPLQPKTFEFDEPINEDPHGLR